MKRILLNSLNSIRQYKLSALLNILGLSIGLTTAFILMFPLFTILLRNVDIKDHERIFRIESRIFNDSWQTTLPAHLATALAEGSPLVESHHACRASDERIYTTSDSIGRNITARILPIDRGTVETFGVEILQGTWEQMFNYDAIAVSRTTAENYALGIGDKVARRGEDGSVSFVPVAVIFEDFPVNSDFSTYDIFSCDRSVGPCVVSLYIKLRDNADKKRFVEGALQALQGVEQAKNVTSENIDDYLRLTPMSRTILHYEVKGDPLSSPVPMAVIIVNIILISLVLLISFINYYNFFIALIPQRIHRANIQKIMGADTFMLRLEIILESIILVILSLLVSLLLIGLTMESSYVNTFLSRTQMTPHLPIIFVTLAIIAIICAIITAIYPALYTTSFSPQFALKGNWGASRMGRFMRNALLFFQYVLSSIFITSATSFYVNKMLERDSGFCEDVLFCKIWGEDISMDYNFREELRGALSDCDNIAEISFAEFPVPFFMNTEFTVANSTGDKFHALYMYADYNLVDIMDIDIIDGRNFSPADCDGNRYIIINESLSKRMGVSPSDELEFDGRTATVVGVCKDFANMHIKSQIEPCLFILDANATLAYMYIKPTRFTSINSVAESVNSQMEKLLNKKNAQEAFMPIRRIGDIAADQDFNIMSMVFTISSLIIIFIALLGVFGIVKFETEHRRKEIAIRRINGATCHDILKLLNRRYMIMVTVAFIFSMPPSFILAAEINTSDNLLALIIGSYLVAFAAIVGLTIAVVSLSAWRTVNRNPAEVVKSGN